ncbi:hypothetical protein SAMN05192561_11026 [Halopenitus malekzadehii]|uniref:Halo transducer protein n=1 Tax=Halopenitus malekzadehii TaxID=1267564 RepID=A0A1H6JH96_9EURY|nr:hypothetical protein [Halopenitus malekzadehii]SEH59118.1 hypothetical protein SAMN05192561_11026 [Halopenitus malekzadehii]
MTETDSSAPTDADAAAADTASTAADPTATDTSTAESLLDHDPTVESVATAVAAGTDRDPAAVRRDLDPVSDDGVLTHDAVDATVSDVSQILATAETRVDLATRAVDDVRAAAEPMSDLGTVRGRFRTLEHRLAALQRRTAELGETVGTARDRLGTPVEIHRSAVDLREAAADAQRVVRVADDLATDVDAFASWLGSPAERTEALAADVEALEKSLQELSTVVEGLEESSTAARTPPTMDGGNDEWMDDGGEWMDGNDEWMDDGGEWIDEDGDRTLEVDRTDEDAWADAFVRTRVLDLLVADLRSETADIQEMTDREDVSVPAPIPGRIDAAERRRAALAVTLSELAAPGWDDRIGARLAATERALARFDPPVPWGRVREALSGIER